MNPTELLQRAKEAQTNAYAPYSGFTVGAALLGKSGKVYTGCNVENASFSPTCCAERVAIFKAVSEGESEFVAIAIAGGKKNEPAAAYPPCGVCRQVLSEFCSEELSVILADGKENVTLLTLGSLLPHRFHLS